jgi:hypothetical protein
MTPTHLRPNDAPNRRPVKKAKNFLIGLLVFSLLFFVAICAFNFVINPYRLYRNDDPSTFTSPKPRPEKYQQQIRTELAKRIPSDVLILGNSTLEIGIDPDDPALKPIGYTFFNHAIAGHNLAEVSAGLEDILKVWRPKHVVLNVSLADYIFSEEIRLKRQTLKPSSGLLFKSLFSIDTTLDSFRTISMQYRTGMQSLTARGHNPMHDLELNAKRAGYRQLFDAANSRILKMMVKYSNGKGIPEAREAISVQDYSELLKKLAKHDLETTVVISPLHRDYQQNLSIHKLLETQRKWKEIVVNETKRVSSRNLIRIVDFGCSQKWTTETIPAKGDLSLTGAMNNYWDSEHFKSAVGTQLLLEIFGSRLPDSLKIRDSAGIDLLTADLELQHARCDALSKQY